MLYCYWLCGPRRNLTKQENYQYFHQNAVKIPSTWQRTLFSVRLSLASLDYQRKNGADHCTDSTPLQTRTLGGTNNPLFLWYFLPNSKFYVGLSGLFVCLFCVLYYMCLRDDNLKFELCCFVKQLKNNFVDCSLRYHYRCNETSVISHRVWQSSPEAPCFELVCII